MGITAKIYRTESLAGCRDFELSVLESVTYCEEHSEC